MKILLADDHGLFVEGLQNLLQAGGYEVVGAASDGFEVLKMARELRPDLILMDIRMPDCNGLVATRLIQTELPHIKIVILSTSAEESDLFDALKSGASGYLLKNLKPEVLFSYLEGFARGEAPLSRELSGLLLREFNRQAAVLDGLVPSPIESSPQEALPARNDGQPACDEAGSLFEEQLTPRQRQILEMIAEGYTYKEVGAELHVSENTVKYHMGEILQRLHAKNREQVVAYALRSGMLRRQERS